MWKFLLAFTAGLACGVVTWFACSSNIWHKNVKKELVVDWELKMHSPTEELHKGEDVVAKQLAQKVRILCMVITDKTFNKAFSIQATWGKRCNVLLFMSTQENTTIPSIFLHETGQKQVWGRIKSSFKYVFNNYIDSVDWVLKTESDTYVIIENLRYLLSNLNSSEALYLGRYFKRKSSGYMNGRSGYVLSKEAVKRLVKEGFVDDKKCRKDSEGLEDFEMGKCLKNLGVKAIDTRDSLNRGRFFPFRPVDHILKVKKWGSNYWYNRCNYFNEDDGFKCCSDLSVTFQTSSYGMYSMEYFLYHLHPHGIRHNVNVTLNRRRNDLFIKGF